MTIQRLSQAKTALINLEDIEGERTPAVGIWLPAISEDMSSLLEEADFEIASYYVDEVARNDRDPDKVDLYFRRAHDTFEDKDLLTERLAQRYVVAVPNVLVSVAFALSLIPEGLPFAFFEGVPPRNVHTKSLPISTAKFLVGFPEPGGMTHDEIMSQASYLFSESYTAPLYPVAFNRVEEHHDDSASGERDITGALMSGRRAQARILEITQGLSHNEESAFQKMLTLSQELNAVPSLATDEKSPGEANEELIHLFNLTHFASSSFRYTVKRENAEAPSIELVDSKSDSQDAYEEVFSEMVADLSDLEEKAPEQSPYYDTAGMPEDVLAVVSPFEHGIPSYMSNFEKFFEGDGDGLAFQELLRWDFTKDGVVEEALESYGTGAVTAAMLMVLAARAKTLSSESPATFIIAVLRMGGDRSFWEFPAFAKSLASYDTTIFKSVLSDGIAQVQNEDDEQFGEKIYLTMLGHGICHRLLEEEWDVENLDEKLKSIDMELPRMDRIRTLVYQMLSSYDADAPDDDDESDESCNAYSVVRAIVETWDINELRELLSLLVPIMADVFAVENELEIGTEDWATARDEFAYSLLMNISIEVPFDR